MSNTEFYIRVIILAIIILSAGVAITWAIVKWW